MPSSSRSSRTAISNTTGTEGSSSNAEQRAVVYCTATTIATLVNSDADIDAVWLAYRKLTRAIIELGNGS